MDDRDATLSDAEILTGPESPTSIIEGDDTDATDADSDDMDSDDQDADADDAG